jgi:CRISPR-associated endoribonuclease Cas6
MKIGFVYRINKLPIDYRACFLSLIKEAINRSDPSLYREFYQAANRETKPFCFSIYLKSFKINNNILLIEDDVTLYISSPDLLEDVNAIGIKIYNGLLNIKNFPFPLGQILKQVNIFPIREKDKGWFAKGEACFKTMSPIIIVAGKNKTPVLHPKTFNKDKSLITQKDRITLDEFVFLQELNFSLKPYISQEVEFIPVSLRKEVIKHSIGEHLQDVIQEPIKLIGFSGRFILRGTPDDLYKIYKLGLGFRRNQGFGMVDVV